MDYGKKDKKPAPALDDIVGPAVVGMFQRQAPDDMVLLERMTGPAVGMFEFAPVDASEQGRARRLVNEMQRLRDSRALADRDRRLQSKMQRARFEDMITTGKMLEAMDLFRAPITRSYNFSKEVADDPFGVAANRAVKDLFGLSGDSMSKTTKFEKIIGDM